MAKRKNNSVSTASKAVETFRNAALGLPAPPDHLKESDLPHWWAIVSAKRREAWSELDLEQAANLAHTLAGIRKLQDDIHTDGFLIDGKKNPMIDILDIFVKRSLALARLLQIHSLATNGKSSAQATRNQAFREAREAMDDGDDDSSLIPGRVQ